MNNAFKFCLDFIFPIECARCGKEKEYLCDYCFSKIIFNAMQTCPLCGKIMPLGFGCSCSLKNHVDIYLTFADLKKNRFILDLIHNFKYNFLEDISLDLARICQLFWRENGKNNILIKVFDGNIISTSVPLHRRRLLWRGFNQADLIVKQVFRLESGILPRIFFNYDYKILVRKRSTTFQAQGRLSERERKLNMEEAFFCPRPEKVKDKTVILFDDVITTGTTMEECAKALKKAGAQRVIAMAVGKG